MQPLLEQRHKEEEERLLRFLAEEREKEMKRLDDTIAVEKEKAAEELLNSFDQMSLQNSVPRSLVEERERIEDHFRRVRDERLRLVTEKISTEEKTRNGKMVDRHCQEMLMLIGEKVRLVFWCVCVCVCVLCCVVLSVCVCVVLCCVVLCCVVLCCVVLCCVECVCVCLCVCLCV